MGLLIPGMHLVCDIGSLGTSDTRLDDFDSRILQMTVAKSGPVGDRTNMQGLNCDALFTIGQLMQWLVLN